ncbi:MAG: hydrogenase nickel incorporation protein HypB [Lachnospiraceae bacterium]|nr:hydrogenase nickel incorporation protein HypB [Lachnospiraceae bacterium]
MNESRVIEVKQNILSHNDRVADEFRKQRREENMFLLDVMGSPGAGKTSFLLALIKQLRQNPEVNIGVIEADLESDVDAMKIKEAGIPSVELNTKGVCHVEMGMMQKAYSAFGGKAFDYLFLENIGNLVCPADFDTGCHKRVMLLSVPEGWDKVCKYPPMFAVVDALIVTKCDYLPLNPDFDMKALYEHARALNPNLTIFETSARTGEGFDAVAEWLTSQRAALLA